MKTLYKDERVRETILPVRVVKTYGQVENAECLLKESVPQICLHEPELMVLTNGEEGEESAVLLDFGRELHGSVRIMAMGTADGKPAHVYIASGESAQEAVSCIGEKNATNDHAIRSTEYYLPMYSDMTLNETGFRFVYLKLKGKNTQVSIKSITAVFIYRDVPYLGTFRCDHEVINQIYDVSAYTCHLCLQNYIWDGIKRDRLVWIGDMHPEMLTIRSVFGSLPIMKESLRIVRDSTPLPGWMCGIQTYSLWWLIVVRDWYFYTGDEELLAENRDYVERLSEQIAELVNEDGSDNFHDYFLDWPTKGKPSAVHGSRAVLVMGLEAAADMALHYGNGQKAGRYRHLAEILKQCEAASGEAKQSTAMMALAGCLDPEKAEDEILKDGAKGFSTFMSYYLLKAAAHKDTAKALDAMEEYYGGMLKMGATTFWEDFDLEWMQNAAPVDELVPDGMRDIHGDHGAYCYEGFRHSLCHGWSSGPTAFLAETVLGIRILEVGCRKVAIRPDLGNLKWAEGTYPTPFGNIFVRCRLDEKGQYDVEYTVPDGIEVVDCTA